MYVIWRNKFKISVALFFFLVYWLHRFWLSWMIISSRKHIRIPSKTGPGPFDMSVSENLNYTLSLECFCSILWTLVHTMIYYQMSYLKVTWARKDWQGANLRGNYDEMENLNFISNFIAKDKKIFSKCVTLFIYFIYIFGFKV